MNNKILLGMILSVAIIFSFTNCSEETVTKEEVTKKENVRTLLLNVEGMTCEGCEKSIQNNLSKLTGVVSVKASHNEKTTKVDFDETKIDAKTIEAEIIATGYKIMNNPEDSQVHKETKEAPKEAMKCGEGKCK